MTAGNNGRTPAKRTRAAREVPGRRETAHSRHEEQRGGTETPADDTTNMHKTDKHNTVPEKRKKVKDQEKQKKGAKKGKTVKQKSEVERAKQKKKRRDSTSSSSDSQPSSEDSADSTSSDANTSSESSETDSTPTYKGRKKAKKTERRINWELINDMWPLEARPKHLQKRSVVEAMDLGKLLKFKEHYEKEAERKGLGMAASGRDAKPKKIKFRSKTDDSHLKLHPARFCRQPLSQPKDYWNQVIIFIINKNNI